MNNVFFYYLETFYTAVTSYLQILSIKIDRLPDIPQLISEIYSDSSTS